jgi:CheY-like chemotaxis protein
MSPPEDVAFVGTVLAVDDCPAMRELICASLECLGYSVQAVDSGWAALDAVHATLFDAIVLDVEMPGLDGMAVGRALRSDERTAAAIIAMHSSVGEAVVRTGFDQYDIYVPKGPNLRQLGEHLDGLVRSRRKANSVSPPSANIFRPLPADR